MDHKRPVKDPYGKIVMIKPVKTQYKVIHLEVVDSIKKGHQVEASMVVIHVMIIAGYHRMTTMTVDHLMHHQYLIIILNNLSKGSHCFLI